MVMSHNFYKCIHMPFLNVPTEYGINLLNFKCPQNDYLFFKGMGSPLNHYNLKNKTNTRKKLRTLSTTIET